MMLQPSLAGSSCRSYFAFSDFKKFTVQDHKLLSQVPFVT